MEKKIMTDDIKIKNLTTYISRIKKYVGDECADALINSLGGDDAIMNATYANDVQSGCAYEGSFIDNLFRLTSFAININNLLPDNVKADKQSIAKVGLLSQVAKVMMYEPNDNSWEVTNRGIVYKYKELEGALRVGERSLLMVMNAGIRLTPEEYEAFRITDKSMSDDAYAKVHSSTLSMVIRQANEIVDKINRDKVKKE